MPCPAPAPESSKQGAKRVLGGHIANVEPEAPKTWSSRRRRRGGIWEWGEGLPLPSRL